MRIAKSIDWSEQELNFDLQQRERAHSVLLVGELGAIKPSDVKVDFVNDSVLAIDITHLPTDADLEALCKTAVEVNGASGGI